MRALCLVLFTAVICLPATAAVVELEPVQDAYVCSCDPNGTNPAGAQYLGQGRVPGPCFLCSFIQWDLAALVPDTLAEPFTTAGLAEALSIQRSLAQRMTYCLRHAGALRQAGKKGNAILYERNKETPNGEM